MDAENLVKLGTMAAIGAGMYYGYQKLKRSENSANKTVTTEQPTDDIEAEDKYQCLPAKDKYQCLPTGSLTDLGMTDIKAPGGISPRTLKMVKTAENGFFKGCNKFLSLTSDQIACLESKLLKEGLSEERIQCINTIKDLLEELRNHGCFMSCNYCYVSKMSKILGEAGIKLSVESGAGKHLKDLEDTIADLLRDDINEIQWDVVLLYSEVDQELAFEFESNVRQFVHLQDGPIRIAQDHEYGAPGGSLQTYDKIFNNAIFIFILVTENFKADLLKRYTGEANLVNSFTDKNCQWRVVPVWMDKESKTKSPFELSALLGIPYFRYLNDPAEFSCFGMIQRLVQEKRVHL